MTYLGHVISNEGIKPERPSLPKLERLLPPRNIKGVQKICGYINWFRPFIKDLSIRAKPITDKLSNDLKFSWTPKDTSLVKNILEELNKDICLSYPDYKLPFQLQTDASDVGMGGVLKQNNKLIALYSKKFSAVQQRYTVSEKELLAVIESLKYFKNLIYLSEIEVKTDHKNLIHNNLDPQTNRMQRWKLLLSEYDIKWKYIKGQDNTAADLLSRCCYSKSKENDQEMGTINQRTPKDPNEEEKIISKVHDLLCHPGTKTMEMAIRKYWKINRLRQKIMKLRTKCNQCQERMRTTAKYGIIKGNIATTEPWKDISSDIYGPVETQDFEESETNSKFYI